MALNLHLLRLFAAVARQSSFSRAADTLHISQPAVSKGVRELERLIGQPLLERGPGAGGVTPTAAGAVLLEHARALFAIERDAEDDLVTLAGLGRGRLDIGASTTIATWLLPPILGAFHTAHPAIALRLLIGNTGQVADAFRARELDIALVEGPVEAGPLRVDTWTDDELVLVTAPRNAPAATRRAAVRQALAGAILVSREPGSGTRDAAFAALRAAGIAPASRLEIGSTEAIRELVAGGIGFAVLGRATVADAVALGRLVILDAFDRPARRTLSRLRLPGRRPSAAAAAFDLLLDAHARA